MQLKYNNGKLYNKGKYINGIIQSRYHCMLHWTFPFTHALLLHAHWCKFSVLPKMLAVNKQTNLNFVDTWLHATEHMWPCAHAERIHNFDDGMKLDFPWIQKKKRNLCTFLFLLRFLFALSSSSMNAKRNYAVQNDEKDKIKSERDFFSARCTLIVLRARASTNINCVLKTLVE